MMNKMMNISTRSDLEIEVVFRDLSGHEIAVPTYDFDLSYFVYRDLVVTASQKDKVLSPNCRIVDDRLHIYFDSPNLGCGILHTRHVLYIPNTKFPDGCRKVVRAGSLDVRLVDHENCYSEYPVIVNDVIAEDYLFTEILTAEDASTILSEEEYEILIDTNNGRNH